MPLPPTVAALLATTNTDKSPQHGLPSLPDATADQLEYIRDYIRSVPGLNRNEIAFIAHREAQGQGCVIPNVEHFVHELVAELANAPRHEVAPFPDATAEQLEKLRTKAWLRLRDCRDPDALAAEAYIKDEAQYLPCTLSEPVVDQLVADLLAKLQAATKTEPPPLAHHWTPGRHGTAHEVAQKPDVPKALPVVPATPHAIVPESDPEPAPLPIPWDRERILKKIAQFIALCQRECEARGEVVPTDHEIVVVLAESVGLSAPKTQQPKKRNRQQQGKESAKHGILAYMTLQRNTRFTVKQITAFLQTVSEQTVRTYLLELRAEGKIEGKQIGTIIAPAQYGPDGKIIEQAKTTNMWYFWIPRL
jgi:hypothetical protein